LLSKDTSKNLVDDNNLMNWRHDRRANSRFKMQKKHLFLLAIVLAFFTILLVYFYLPSSDVFHVSVSGNSLLESDYIKGLTNVSNEDKFLLINSSNIKSKVLESPYISEANVSKEEGNIINVEVVEKKINAYLLKDNKYYFWFSDDTYCEIDDAHKYLMSRLPFIEGFTDEQLSSLQIGFRDLSQEDINEISEIHSYPISYDDNYMEVIMRDGNYVFVDVYSLPYLQNYYRIWSGLSAEEGLCLYLDDFTGKGYSGACPWQEEVQQDSTEETDNQEE